MAVNIVETLRVFNAFYLVVDADPSTSTGVVAGVGSLAIGPTGITYQKTTLADTGWIVVATPGGSGPTGDVDSIAYFDAAGNLNSNPDAGFDDTLNSMFFGSTNAGAGVLTSTGLGSLARGSADTGGTITSSSQGTDAHGLAQDAASLIVASGIGSEAFGYVQAGGILSSAGSGSQVSGLADGAASSIVASNDGAHAGGKSSNGGVITASGLGATARGRATNAGSTITASGIGSFAYGSALGGGDILASNIASFAFGVSGAGTDPLTSSGIAAATFGESNVNPVYACLAAGRFASIAGSSAAWVATDPLFVLGIGTGTGTEANAFSVGKDANVKLYRTITAGGTTGAQVIDKPAGSVNFAALAASLVVTNNLVTSDSIVICQIQTHDASAVLGAVVPGAGSFEIFMDVVPTAETRVSFLVIN